MEVGKNKLKSIIKQVQNSAETLTKNRLEQSTSLASLNTNCDTQLDLPSAIEYNYCLINSYLQERGQRKLSPYEEILKTLTEENDEQTIINGISAEFYLDPKLLNDTDEIDNNNNNNGIESNSENQLDGQSRIIEMCVLNKLPEFIENENEDDEKKNRERLLSYIENERKKLTNQHTIVSKRLTEMILINDKHFKKELERIRSIENDLTGAIKICLNGRQALNLSKRDFTDASLKIIKNHHCRETILTIIDCLQKIKKLRQTIEHIEYMLQYEKNFSSAINLFDEKLEILESMSEKYCCVAEMKEKLVETLQLVDDQMDAVLQKITVRFCLDTYSQLCKAYSQIGKYETSINQLLLHFTNTIHDKAFSIVLGYVKLFLPEHVNACSTPIKLNHKKPSESTINSSVTGNINDLKRKPFAELCQYLNPESFLQCLTDLCRALWDIMNNYYQILCFYNNDGKDRSTITLPDNEIEFAKNKLSQGVLKIWSDVQHKIRTLVSSVQFVNNVDQNNSLNDSIASKENTFDHNQDQLLFSFEEFIKILTVCERMIEIGEQFCLLYSRDEYSGCNTIEFQNTLYQQTRAYFQSYHQVSMSELKIFLENEIWTRCPIDTADEFELIASLQEFLFMKNRLLKIKQNSCLKTKNSKNSDPNSPITRATNLSTSFLLSPTTKLKKYFSKSYFCSNYETEGELENEEETPTPFDGIMSYIVTQETFCDSDGENVEDNMKTEINENVYLCNFEIVTTNTTLNVLRLMGRYMNIMFLLRPISFDIIKALMELFDYYFYTIYHFFALDMLNATWIGNCNSTDLTSEIITMIINQQQQLPQQTTNTGATIQQQQARLLNHFSSFIRRINDTLIQNDSGSNSNQQQNILDTNSSSNSSPSKLSSATSSPTKNAKYPCPTLSDYVLVNSQPSNFALGERIMAIQSLIFIARQFYNLCPFLIEFLRNDSYENDNQHTDQNSNETINVHLQQQHFLNKKKSTEDGFKLLQFYYDKMFTTVASLQYQCLYTVSSKLLPYETIVSLMSQTKWDLKEIPSIHSSYINVFVKELLTFDVKYRKLLQSYDLSFLLQENFSIEDKSTVSKSLNDNLDNVTMETNDVEMPLVKLCLLSKRMNIILYECLLKISNRTFVEGFSTAKKCTNEGRALMQLDYEQFLSHMEKLMLPYFKAASDVLNPVGDTCSNNTITTNTNYIKTMKLFLANERLFVEEFVKAFYITETTFIEWIRQKPDYTTKQIVSLINCITVDNKKLRSLLLAAIDTTSIDNNSATKDNIAILSPSNSLNSTSENNSNTSN